MDDDLDKPPATPRLKKGVLLGWFLFLAISLVYVCTLGAVTYKIRQGQKRGAVPFDPFVDRSCD